MNVVIDDQSAFDYAKLVQGVYKLEALGGQHLLACDKQIAQSYKKFELIPKSISFKQCTLFLNLSSEDKKFLVQMHNKAHEIVFKTTFFQKVCAEFSFMFVRNYLLS